MSNSQILSFITQRVNNEVDILKRRKDKLTKYDFKDTPIDDDDEFDGNIQYTEIEHLENFKQVRVGFSGRSLSDWRGALYYFIIKYENYPCKPVRIEFPKEFRHQYIIQNTGIYCHPDWSEKYWVKSTSLEQIINRVIQTFHEIPTYSDYPVDLSIVQLSLNKEEYQKVIKTNKVVAANYNTKITEERQYHENKKKQQQEQEKKKKQQEEEQQLKILEQKKQDDEKQRKLIEQQDQANLELQKKAYEYQQQFQQPMALQNQLINQPKIIQTPQFQQQQYQQQYLYTQQQQQQFQQQYQYQQNQMHTNQINIIPVNVNQQNNSNDFMNQQQYHPQQQQQNQGNNNFQPNPVNNPKIKIISKNTQYPS